MEVARACPGVELVAADAMTVSRGLDIGTAKATAAERAEVAHHCLDLVDASAEVSLFDYLGAARGALADISGRGASAVLVGGTGLYVQAVVDALELPGTWPALRAELEAEAAAGPAAVAALHRRLAGVDPAAAALIDPANARRVVRALEVWAGSGRPFSSFGPGLSKYPPVATRLIGLSWGRDTLTDRIETRVRAQLDAGWLDEVARVWPSCGRSAQQVIGYRELADHLDGRAGLDEAVAAVVARTRRFAVRQERWFRRDPRIEWYCGDQPEAALDSVVDRCIR